MSCACCSHIAAPAVAPHAAPCCVCCRTVARLAVTDQRSSKDRGVKRSTSRSSVTCQKSKCYNFTAFSEYSSYVIGQSSHASSPSLFRASSDASSLDRDQGLKRYARRHVHFSKRFMRSFPLFPFRPCAPQLSSFFPFGS